MSTIWSPEHAWRWYDSQPWPCGFNYVPANAISYTEMWMDYAFDPELIDRELALAEKIGFNCLRVVLPFVVWEAERDAFVARLDRFASICSARGLSVMFALFDDCVFGPIEDPVFGVQPEVVAGWYANGWTPSPGPKVVSDPSTWPKLEAYVKDIIGHFAHDSRIWVWDLYNEPTNNPSGDATIPLVERVFEWAREIGPVQPLTVGCFNNNEPLNETIARLSDITTYHDYTTPESTSATIAKLREHGVQPQSSPFNVMSTSATIAKLREHGRPMICTEWLNRCSGSTIECLAVFRGANVGCMHWGLVNGKTQTHLNWGHRPGDPEPARWQHDLYRGDHSEYDPSEIAAFVSAIDRGRV